MTKADSYIPERGDIVWIDFEPQKGKEIMKRRPALVLSPAKYNRFGLMLCCPLTTKAKGRPFEVRLPSSPDQAVLSDQVKSFDWRQRRAELKEQVDPKTVQDVIRRIAVLLVE
ncbi:MAG: endoribonuclease MazF [Alphaproteobacteria bacterium]|nr:endoribonuclease MazF [Alphaproteobacteria bacterium]